MASERSAMGGADRLTLTVEEAAHLLGISRGLAYELARCGKLPVIRLGHRILIPRVALEKMLSWPSDTKPNQQ